ncbi:MAG: hypothetical protein E6Q40_05035 [Cupriavidus sp.]|nr:MAG: hypothetical protein E6Q40_05035 [Cupriavidus sp.]
MDSKPNPEEGSTATVLGMLTGLIVGEVGAAFAIIGALWTAYACLNQASLLPRSEQWKDYLVAGGLFVAILTVCRLTRRS